MPIACASALLIAPLHCVRVHTTWAVDIVYIGHGNKRILIDTNQEPISYRLFCHMASSTVQSASELATSLLSR